MNEFSKLPFVFFSTTNHQTKLPYNLNINNNNNQPQHEQQHEQQHQQYQQQNVQNERKISNHLGNIHDHYQLNGINWHRQRFKRDTNNLYDDDNELLVNFEGDGQNDGNQTIETESQLMLNHLTFHSQSRASSFSTQSSNRNWNGETRKSSKRLAKDPRQRNGFG